jgi:hypothetical protein
MGKLSFENGDFYVGTFYENKYEGKGQFVSKISGFVYNGDFRNGLRWGYGF